MSTSASFWRCSKALFCLVKRLKFLLKYFCDEKSALAKEALNLKSYLNCVRTHNTKRFILALDSSQEIKYDLE